MVCGTGVADGMGVSVGAGVSVGGTGVAVAVSVGAGVLVGVGVGVGGLDVAVAVAVASTTAVLVAAVVPAGVALPAVDSESPPQPVSNRQTNTHGPMKYHTGTILRDVKREAALGNLSMTMR
jgi:hypothetical protein